MTTPTATSSSNPTTDVTKDNVIPIFTNKTEHYKEWRQRIQLYYKKMALLNKKKEAAINLLTSLTDIAWRLGGRLNIFLTSFATMRMASTRPSKCWMPAFNMMRGLRCLEPWRSSFTSCNGGQIKNLLAYTSEHREQLREIEKYNIKLPPSVSGWLMLRRSGLTLEQRQMVQSQCGTTKVEAAMFFLFGQDYRSRP